MVALLLCAAWPAGAQQLPDGPGKELVAVQCNSCHPFYARVGAGYTAQGWRTVMRMMLNHGVAIPPDQLATMTEYLAKNFPERTKPIGVIVAGPAKISIKEWQVPTPGSRPHDPLATRDGALWYSESGTTPNTVVRFDPRTEKFQSWALPGGGNIVRNTSVTPDGHFVLANSLVNAVTLVTIAK
jgi:virginiamycin B lyase